MKKKFPPVPAVRAVPVVPCPPKANKNANVRLPSLKKLMMTNQFYNLMMKLWVPLQVRRNA